MEHTESIAAGRAAGEPRHGRAAAPGDALHPGRLHPVVLHARGGPGAVRAAVAGRRLRDGRVVPALQHVRPGPLGLAPPAPATARRDADAAFARSTGSATLYGRVLGRVVRLALAGRPGLSRRGGARHLRGRPATRPGDLPEGRCRAVPAPDQGAGRDADREDRADRHGRARRDHEGGRRRTGSRSRSATSASSRRATRSTRSTSGPAGPRRSILRVALHEGAGVDVEALKAAAPRRAHRPRCRTCSSRSSRPTSSAR